MEVNRQKFQIVSEEPYRVFFPIALVVSVLGVILWPLFYAGRISWIPNGVQLSYYPSFVHARLMIEGFVGGFAMGFVGTAMPKLLGAKSLRNWQVGALLVLYVSYVVLHVCNHTRAGDLLFAAMIGFMLLQTVVRVRKGNQLPPPGMVLAGLGLLSGAIGAFWMSIAGLQGNIYFYAFAQRLLYQVFILLPLMGIGSYIFPMILGTPLPLQGLSGKERSLAWRKKAWESLALGILIITTYWVEVHGQMKEMSWVRFVLCAAWLTKECGWLHRKTSKGVMGFSLRAGILCVLCSMVATGILSDHKVALDHVLYVGGFGLITMMVATRVIYGHSGQGNKFQQWVKPIAWTTGLILFDMFTRVTADFLPEIIFSHHVYAALLWVMIAIIWGVALLPSVKKQPFSQMPMMPKKNPLQSKASVMDLNFRK